MRERGYSRVIQIAPGSRGDVFALGEAEEAEVVDERAVGEDDMHVEAEPLEDLHLGHDQRVFQVVEGVAEVGHWDVFEVWGLGGGRRRGRMLEFVGGTLEQQVIDVDEVAHADGAFLQFGR